MSEAEVVKQNNGKWTVHVNGIGNPGKVYDCEGATPYEAIEHAAEYVDALEDWAERLKKK